MPGVIRLLALLGAVACLGGMARAEAPFAKGADVGWLSEMEANGDKFYDASGKPGDCLQILKDYGINAVRLRVWVNPKDGWCGEKDVVTMAKRAQEMGLRVMIDFHYSDTWADPQHQPKPAAWKGHDPAQLAKDVYDHTYEVLSALKDAGVTPEWVQVGNEITYGMLWPDGDTKHVAQLVAMINRGYDAVKAVDPHAIAVIHLDNGGDNKMYRRWFDTALKDGVKFDAIGMSLYPDRGDWKRSADACLANTKDMIARYGRPVVISEIGYFANDPQNSREFLAKMIRGCEAIRGGKVLGLFYWEPEGYGKRYDRIAWGEDGKPTAAMDAFKAK